MCSAKTLILQLHRWIGFFISSYLSAVFFAIARLIHSFVAVGNRDFRGQLRIIEDQLNIGSQ